MLLPDFIYGRSRVVKRRCEKMGKTVTSREHYLETMLSMGMRDTAGDSDLLVVDGPSPTLAKVEAYQLYYPLDEVWCKQPPGPAKKQLIKDIFEESLKTAWGTLLLTPNPYCWGYFGGRVGEDAGSFDEARCRAFLRALFAHWDEIEAIGPRFSNGGYDTAPLLARHTMIFPVVMKLRGMTNAEGARADWTKLFHEIRAKGDI